jgi:hypothetical protein
VVGGELHLKALLGASLRAGHDPCNGTSLMHVRSSRACGFLILFPKETGIVGFTQNWEKKQATRERLEIPFPFLRDKFAGICME